MIFTEGKVKDAFVIDPERIEDERGFFTRVWCRKEFGHLSSPQIAQANVVFSRLKGTLRGMHFQAAPFEEAKLVRCTQGAIYDVTVDLRPESPTYKQWVGAELTADNRRMLYVPEGCAHGFETLVDNTEIYYLATEFYMPQAAWGVRPDDPAFGIEWPLKIEVISSRDRSWPDYSIVNQSQSQEEAKRPYDHHRQ